MQSTDAVRLDQISQTINMPCVPFVISIHKNDSKRQATVLASYRLSFTPRRRIRRTVVIVQFFHRKMFVESESNDRHWHPGGWFRRLYQNNVELNDSSAHTSGEA
jgi:hypothetical protein